MIVEESGYPVEEGIFRHSASGPEPTAAAGNTVIAYILPFGFYERTFGYPCAALPRGDAKSATASAGQGIYCALFGANFDRAWRGNRSSYP
jgi:hypothetical protein